MDDTPHTILAGWGNFYLVAGTAADVPDVAVRPATADGGPNR